MTYLTGGPIEASDYNTFASQINAVFADTNAGATTLPLAGFGYGQTQLTSAIAKVPGDAIAAVDWNGLFNSMRLTGTHQGTTVVPPLPATGPVSGDTVVAFNTPTALATVVTNLTNNKNNIALGQTSLVTGTPVASASTWTNTLTYSFKANFGSWNNARHFFNSGGSLQMVGAWPGASSPVELAFRDAISAPRAPFVFNWNSTTAATGSNDAPLNPIGFWKEPTNALTTVYQIVYQKVIGSGSYSNSSVIIEAKLSAAPGTNGEVDFLISLVDNDPTPNLKSFPLNFTVNYAASSGAVVYTGGLTITSLGFTYS